MRRFFSSKIFIIVFTLFSFIAGAIAGWLLGYQPKVNGTVFGSSTMYGGTTTGSTSTKYVFQFKTACGYWLIALVATIIVFLLCVLINKAYVGNNADNND